MSVIFPELPCIKDLSEAPLLRGSLIFRGEIFFLHLMI